jgi:integrase
MALGELDNIQLRKAMSIRKNPNRKKNPYEYRWLENGRHHSRSFPTRKEAQTFEAGHISAISKGRGFRATNEALTVDYFATIFLQQKKKELTTKRNQGIYDRHIRPVLGSRRIQLVRHTDIQLLVNSWTDAGLSPRTVWRQIAVLSKIFSLAERDDVIPRNPTKFLDKPEASEPHRYVMTVAEVQNLRRTIHPNYEAFIYTLFETGMRISEAISLNIGDFDWAGGLLKITSSKTKAGIRKIPISSTAATLISMHVKSTGRTMANSTEPLFVSHRTDSSGLVIGSRIDYSNFRSRVFKPAAVAIGLPELQAHDSRRTSATLLVSENAPPKVTQERMGHDDYRTTNNLYAQGTEKDHRDVVEMMERVLNPGPGEKEKEA